MPSTRNSSATIMNPVRHQQRISSSAMPAMPSPATRLTNLTSIAAQSLTATYTLWAELIENQNRFAVRLLNAMGASTKPRSRPLHLSSATLISSNADNRHDERDHRQGSVEKALSSAVTDAPRRGRGASKPKPPESEFPIKRYDTLIVQEIIGRLDRLRDPRHLRTVLAYEEKNKARKGIAAAGQARLKRLGDS